MKGDKELTTRLRAFRIFPANQNVLAFFMFFDTSHKTEYFSRISLMLKGNLTVSFWTSL